MVAQRTETPTLPALAELQKLRQWVVWCYEKDKNGRPTKVPYSIKGYKASTTKSRTWASYEEAKRIARSGRNQDDTPYNGYGFVFNDDYTGVDFDHCVNPDGSIDEWAAIELERLASYAENSPSGTGIHVIVRGLLPEGLDKDGKKCRPGTRRPIPNAPQKDAAIEMYCEGRFFTFTEKHLSSTPITIESRQNEILALHGKYASSTTEKPKVQRVPTQPLDLTDNDLLSKAAQAKNGNKFVALWSGDYSGYISQSEADQALCNLLAFWTRCDASRMNRLFCQSGLYREDRWNKNARSGETYGEGTIKRAID